MIYNRGIMFGCFDLFHIGHKKAIIYAMKYCKQLYIGLLTDEAIEQYKGKKPIVPYVDRYNTLHSAFPTVKLLKINERRPYPFINAFDITFVSEERRNKKLYIIPWSFTGELIYIPYTKGISSTILKRGIENENNKSNN